MKLIETSTFTKQITALLSDEDYGIFQSWLAANPSLGALINGGGGIRKIRVAVGSRGKRQYGNNDEARIPGQQLTLFPKAPQGLVFYGDKGLENGSIRR